MGQSSNTNPGPGRRRQVVVTTRRRIGQPKNRIRLAGRTLAELRLLEPADRTALLSLLDHAAVIRMGHRHRVAALQSARPDDHVGRVEALLNETEVGLTEALLNDMLAPILESTWERLVDHLGEHSGRPTAAQITEAGRLVAEEQSVHQVRLFLAAAVELSLPAKDEILSLDPASVPFALVSEKPTSATVAAADAATSPERREERRQRRKAASEQRAALRAQRTTGVRRRLRRRRPSTAVPVVPRSEHETAATDSAPELERMEHPRLPAEAKVRAGPPVGLRGQTIIRWGPLPTQGKARPVVIIGASKHHLWVRAIYTRDLVAGRWRSVRIDDWAEFGLDHPSYVELDVRRIARKSCKISTNLMTARDWNRVCRGEVHD